MILDFILGAFVSGVSIIIFIYIRYLTSLNNWILDISKFIYLSGNPVLNEDQIFDQIKVRFTHVVASFGKVLFKTAIFFGLLGFLIVLSTYISKWSTDQDLSFSEFHNGSKANFFGIISSTQFIFGTFIPILLIPFLRRNNSYQKPTYSSFDKFLHYVFLGNKNVGKILFGLESRFRAKELDNKEHKSVYVSGLARAGTTALMQYLGQLDLFKSVSYQNLPFLFMPKTGKAITSSGKNKVQERFHKDGIKHSVSSYEALEEPFWRIYIGHYISDEYLRKHDIEDDIFNKYNTFRRLIANDKIYLAKNNNHLLRAKSISEKDQSIGNKAITFIPFRKPLDQSRSLMKQHDLLIKEQNKDEFVLDYMDLLVHHEFGQNFKFQLLGENSALMNVKGEKNSLKFWLQVWYQYYLSAYNEFKQETNFFSLTMKNLLLIQKDLLKPF